MTKRSMPPEGLKEYHRLRTAEHYDHAAAAKHAWLYQASHHISAGEIDPALRALIEAALIEAVKCT